jgi:hypothetical protein
MRLWRFELLPSLRKTLLILPHANSLQNMDTMPSMVFFPAHLLCDVSICKAMMHIGVSYSDFNWVLELLQIDTDRREDARLRDPDYDSHLGIKRDPVTREVVVQASHT